MAIDVAGFDWAWLASQGSLWLLVQARVLGLCLTAPILRAPELDWRLRLGIWAVVGAALFPLVQTAITAHPGGGVRADLWAVLSEVLTGGVLGWSAALIVAGARLAGELVAAQAGFSTSTLIDPESGEEMTPLGRLHGLLALAVFVALDGPLMLTRALVESYEAVPMGRLLFLGQPVSLAFAQVGHALELALQAAAPTALALTLAGIAVGWMGRAAPALPFVTLAVPLRAVLGIVLIFLSLATLAATYAAAWTAIPWLP